MEALLGSVTGAAWYLGKAWWMIGSVCVFWDLMVISVIKYKPNSIESAKISEFQHGLISAFDRKLEATKIGCIE